MKRIVTLIVALVLVTGAMFLVYRYAPEGKLDKPGAGASQQDAADPVNAGDQPAEEREATEEHPRSEVGPSPRRTSLNADLVAANYDASDTPSPAATLPETWKESQKASNDLAILVGDEDELPIQAVQTSVRVDGFRARVIVDAFFYNDNTWPLEGRFKLRLPDGATPFYLAFGGTEAETAEISPGHPLLRDAETSRTWEPTPEAIFAARASDWSAPKEARMVTREKAARAFRETVREAIDPALLEWSGPGIFSAALYPIQPEEIHHVVFGYDVDLVVLDDTLQLALPLPDVPVSTVDLDVTELQPMDVTVKLGNTSAKPNDRADGRRFYRFDNAAGKTVTVQQQVKGSIGLNGVDKEVGPFFAARVRPDIPETSKEGGAARAVFMLDTSLSSNPDQFNIWRSLLRATLNNNRDRIEEFAVLYFDVERRWWQERWVENTSDNVDALLDDVDTQALEGATDLGSALAQVTAPNWAGSKGQPWDVFLLSDGAASWGEGDHWALSTTLVEGNAGPLFAFHTGLSGGNRPLLDHLAGQSGGAVFSVTGKSEVTAASTAYRSQPWFLEDLTVTGGSDLLIGGNPRMVYPGQTLHIVGRGELSADAEVVLSLARPDTETITPLAEPIVHVLDSPLASRAYGLVAVGQLESLGHFTESEAAAYARHFRVVGKTASLVMLESEADYESHDISPKDDAAVVSQRTATDILAAIYQRITDQLTDPKARFLAWFDRLDQQPGFYFTAPEELRAALESMPRSSFLVPLEPLEPVAPAEEIPGSFKRALADRSFASADIEEEAERRRQKYGVDDAIAVLSSLVEEHPGNPVVARDVGFRAYAWGRPDQAFHLFRRVAESRPHEPQSYHTMALSLAEAGYDDLALAYFEVALHGQWDNRFGDFRTIATADYLRFLRQVEADSSRSLTASDYAATRLETLSENFGVKRGGMIVSMGWNTDMTDVDLHVLEPTGEEAFYNHPDTKIGGHITQDVTQGYGPEMYTLSTPTDGTYVIKAKYYSSDLTRTTTRTRVYVTTFTGWGTEAENVNREVIVLESTGEVQEVTRLQL